MCLGSNEKRFLDYLSELIVIEEPLQKIDIKQIDKSDAGSGSRDLVEHVRRYHKDLFLLKDYRSVIEDVGIGFLDRNRDLQTTVLVDRVVLGTVVIPDAHVGARNEINFLNVVADDPAGKTADRLLILTGNGVIVKLHY